MTQNNPKLNPILVEVSEKIKVPTDSRDSDQSVGKKNNKPNLKDISINLPEPQFSDNALEILNKRYLNKEEGEENETAKDLLIRVADFIAQNEENFPKSSGASFDTAKKFYHLMTNLEFFPNSPTLRGAGRKIHQLAACFVVPIEDSIEGIFDTLKNTALIHKGGGGTGFSFGRLRPHGDKVGSTGGVAGGPLSFMSIFDTMAREVMQGGTRVGANMGILPVNHPDILAWIDAKVDGTRFSNFNLSVSATDDFMNKIEKNEPFDLINPRNGKKVGELNAGDVFDKIIENAWKNGDPGIIFMDEMNRYNPTPEIGAYESTNPCITAESLIPTNKGLFGIGKLAQDYPQENIEILNNNGFFKPTRIFSTGMKETFILKTKAGYELRATGNHPILTRHGWVRLEDLQIDKDEIQIQNKEGNFGSKKLPFKTINTYKGKNGRQYQTNLPTHWSYDLGLLLGWLIGDGNLHGSQESIFLYFGKKDESVLKIMTKIIKKYYGKDAVLADRGSEWQISINSKLLFNFVQDLGVKRAKAESKTVPESIFTASKDAVIGFLSGLFSSDGTINFVKDKSSYIRLSSASLELLKDVQRLLINLGIFSRIYENRKAAGDSIFHYINQNGEEKNYAAKAYHELEISRQDAIFFIEKIGFSGTKHQQKIQMLLKKKDNQRGYYQRERFDAVKSITPSKIEEVFDLTEPITHSFVANGITVHNCGEQVLLPYESCNLGSINLARFVREEKIDWEHLREVTRLAVRFMDNVIDLNRYFVPEIEKMTKGNRKIGLGVMGFADMLAMLEIPYNSEEGTKLAEKVMKFIQNEAVKMSEELALDRGVFPNFQKSIFKGKTPRRNATVTTIAPTGTLSLLGNCAGGIEPFFAIVYKKKSIYRRDGTAEVEQVYVNPLFEKIAKKEGFYSPELMEKIANSSSLKELDEIPEKFKEIFVTAHDITPEWHIKMQAAFQKYTDNAVSKTINFPNSATDEDVKNAYLLAYKLKCKGLTVYRDGSRENQVLTTGASNRQEKSPDESQTIVASPQIKIMPRERPDVIRGYTYRIKTAYGKLFITINDDEFGSPFEVFSHLGKAGGFFAAKAEAICRLISLALRSGIAAEEVIDQLKGIRGPTPTWSEEGKMILSLPDAVAQILEKHIAKSQANLALDFKSAEQPALENIDAPEKKDPAMANGFSHQTDTKPLSLADIGEAPACPECGAMLEISEGCLKCNLCGFSKCG